MAIHPKYLVNIGVFSAIYLVVFLGTAALGFFGFPFLFVGWVVGTIINGAVIALYRQRTPIRFALTAIGAMEGFVALSRGYSWYTLLGGILLGLIGDLIAGWMGGETRQGAMVSYAVFAPWIALPFTPILVNRDAYFAQLAANGVNPVYINALATWITPGVLLAWVIALLVVGLIGGWFGTKVVHKHFSTMRTAS